jgi:hypothetical protein
MFLHLCQRQSFRPEQKTDKIIVLFVLIFTLFDSSGEDRRFWIEW